jgi:hypothetical protein
VIYVSLIELPVPKKVSGNIVVWIDANVDENYEAFELIKNCAHMIDTEIIQLESNEIFKIWLA